MKLINQTLHVEVRDLTACGFSRSYIDKATSMQNKSLPYSKERGAKLFPFEQLGARYKEAIVEKFGDPYQYVQKSPIKDLVKYDLEADKFFSELMNRNLYTFSDDWVLRNSWAASWLNMILKYSKKEIAKQQLNMSVDTFYKNVCDLIKRSNINLPYSEKRLRLNLKEYEQQGYAMFIHGNTGKVSNAAKVNDEQSEAILLSLIEDPRQLDDVLICFTYNIWARENKYKEINPATVGNWRRAKAPEITTGRCGRETFNEKYIRPVKGLKPSAPFVLWESDDNNLDFYYQNNESQWNKAVSYVVVDSYCGLVLGRSFRIAKSPTVDMVKMAYIDAMYYVRSLTKGWHIPFELKADHWQEKTLYPYFKRIANFVPPAHFNKHRGYIEQFFGSTFSKRCAEICSEKNYNGNNITAKNFGVNQEELYLNKNSYPDTNEGVEMQLQKYYHLLRHFPDFKRENMKAPSKQQQWLDGWNKLTDEQKRPISDMQFLQLFGFTLPNEITITARGAEFQMNNIKYSYDLPNPVEQMYLIGEKVNVIYDPYDLSRILVTNGKNIRFIANSATLIARALHDAEANSRTMLNSVLSVKKEQSNHVSKNAAKRKIIVTDNLNEKALQMSGYMPKEIRNEIEHDYINQQQNKHAEKYENFLDSNLDLTGYTD